MIGPSPQGKGGVASVVAVLQQSGFCERHDVRYIATHSTGTALHKLATAAGACWQVLCACVLRRPRLVHAHSASRGSFMRKSLMLAIARTAGCQTVFHLHGAEFQQFSTQESGPLMRWWIRRTLSQSSVVIALSDSWADFLRGYAPAARVRVVANSVEVGPAADPALEEPARILFLGRAERRKGIFELLAALAALAPDYPALRLAIGGDGDLDEVARAVAQHGLGERVTLLGWAGPQLKQAELARAAIFVLPSYDEGLPMALLEAMAAGKAVVATPVGGIPQAVSDGGNGLLVAPRDVAALAAALRSLLDDAALRQRLGGAARATVVARFSTEAVLGRLDAIYAELGVR